MQTSNLLEAPNALEELLSSVIAQERREWDREHKLALAQRDAIVADLKRETAEARLELKQIVQDVVLWAEVTISKTLENVRDGVDGKDGIDGRAGIDGKDGINGIDGRDGIAGTNGTDGTNGKDGLQGIQGEPGIAGKDGSNGADGKNGETGKDGKDGEQGTPGIAGSNGKNGEPGSQGIPGEQGIRGENGKDGEPGIAGKDGAVGKDGLDGTGVAGAFIERNGNLVITLSNGAAVPLGVVIGKDGKDGRDGVDGTSVSRAEIETIAEIIVEQKQSGTPNLDLLQEVPTEITGMVGRAIALLAESPPVPEWKAREVTRVTKHDPQGRILEFERRMVNE